MLAAAILSVFSPCLTAGFLNWDDPKHLVHNPFLPLHGWSDVGALFSSPAGYIRIYIPLTLLSFGAERAVWGLDPFVFHLNNILLHIATASLVMALARRLGLSAKGSLLAALIFALHPMRVESVAWVTERKDVLFGAFYMGALVLYWDYLCSSRGRLYIASLACAIASVLAKPTAFSLPLVFFLLDHMAGRKWTTRRWMEKVPFILTLWPVAMITVLMHVRPASSDLVGAFLTWSYCATFYVIKFFFPAGMATIYAVPRPLGLERPEYFWAVVLLVGITGTVWLLRRRRWVVFAFLFYLVSIFSVLQTELYRGAIGIVNDRFMYIPCVGFALLSGRVWDRLLPKDPSGAAGNARTGWILAGIIVAALSMTTFNRCFVWHDNLVFWNDVLRGDPDNTFALINRAASLLEDKSLARRYGLTDPARYDLALQDLQKAVRRAPGDTDAWNNMGIVLNRLGRVNEAEAAFSQVGKRGGVVRR